MFVICLYWHQIYSQCNIYEAGQKKVAFKYLTEKVNALHGIIFRHILTGNDEIEEHS